LALIIVSIFRSSFLTHKTEFYETANSVANVDQTSGVRVSGK
jgi:hypothetical protein